MKPTAIKNRRTTETIAADNLYVDHRVQRGIVPSRVKKIAAEMDLDTIGVVTVNRRYDGTNSIVDGQHRTAALMQLDLGEWKVKCDVYHGLDLNDEARLWRRLNNTRRPSAFDDFHAALVEGDVEAVTINDIVESHGLRVTNQHRDGSVCAIKALRSIYRGGSQNGSVYPERLGLTLGVAISAWGRTAAATEGDVIQGLGVFLSTYGGDLDISSLTTKLGKFPGGPYGLLGKARALADMAPGKTVPKHMATILTGVYNSGRRTGRVGAPS